MPRVLPEEQEPALDQELVAEEKPGSNDAGMTVDGRSEDECDGYEAGRMPTLCVHCLEEGSMITSVESFPGFRTGLPVWDFTCQTCNHRSRQVQFVGSYADEALRYHLKVESLEDLNRQIIKGENATISIPELEFEILGSNTPCTILTRGDVTTVSELLGLSISNLQMNQHERAAETAAAIDAFLEELKGLAQGDRPFTLVLEDPSGNSFIASAGDDDVALSKETYTRSVREALAVGIPVEAEVGERQLESVAEEEVGDEDQH